MNIIRDIDVNVFWIRPNGFVPYIFNNGILISHTYLAFCYEPKQRTRLFLLPCKIFFKVLPLDGPSHFAYISLRVEKPRVYLSSCMQRVRLLDSHEAIANFNILKILQVKYLQCSKYIFQVAFNTTVPYEMFIFSAEQLKMIVCDA